MNEPLPPNNMNLPPQGMGINPPKRSLPFIGIAGVVMGIIALTPVLGVSIPGISTTVQGAIAAIGVLNGLVAIFRQQLITGILAAALCVGAFILNPALKTLAICTITPSAEQCEKKDEGTKLDIKIPGEESPAETGKDAQPAAPQVPLAAPAEPLPLMEAPSAPAQPAAEAPAAPTEAPAEAPAAPQAMPDAAAVPPQGEVAPAAPAEQAPAAPAAEQVPAPVPEQPAAQPVAEPAAAQ